MKYAYIQATPRLPAPIQGSRRLVVRARLRRDGRHRVDPVPHGTRDRLDPLRPPPRADRLGDRDRRRRPGTAGAERREAPGRRSGVAGRRGRPARRAVLGAPVARARVLRPPADRAADVARHRRPAVGPLLPRLRPDLHRPVDRHDRARRGRDVRAPARRWRRCRCRRCRSWS